MRFRILRWVTAISLLAVLMTALQMYAQEHTKENRQHRYKFVDIGTFGGPVSFINAATALGSPNQINEHGIAVGAAATLIPMPPESNLSICGGPDSLTPLVFHGFKWDNGIMSDLEALPGDDNCSIATSINNRGEIVGQSENGKVDPLTGVREARAVLWKNGMIRSLGTFGGNHSLVSNINDDSQVVGLALNAIADPLSIYDLFILGSSNGTQTRAFLWENGHKRDLGTLGGPDAFAGFVNKRGQVIGFSYTNSTPNPTTGLPSIHPFLWDKDTMKDIGTLGGTFATPSGLNNKGWVIGHSNLKGDEISGPFLWKDGILIDLFTETMGGNPIFANALNDAGNIVGAGAFPDHPFDAFVWKNGVAHDLGALDGDCYSQAFIINSKGQILGESYPCDFSRIRPFLWEDGLMFDLQTLVPADLHFRVAQALSLNDRGVIGGNGAPKGCDVYQLCGHAYLLIPCKDHSDCQDENTNFAMLPGTSGASKQRPSPDLSLSPREIAAQIQFKFGRKRGLSVLKVK
jgi:probable HAF family extracellular repeat protein